MHPQAVTGLAAPAELAGTYAVLISFEFMNPTIGISVSLFAALALNSSRGTGADKTKPSFDSRADSVAIVTTVSRFHSALERGDTTIVRTLLARDLRVLEGGEAETREQYLAHHLAADIEFAKAVRGQRTLISYTREGNVSWLVSTSTAKGSFRGRNIDSIGAELIVLSKRSKEWQIRVIHWSSGRRAP